MDSFIKDTARARAALRNDPHRPRFHFLPPSNWINDPNGLIEWDGKYHLFYQHNPAAPVWDNIHWGHAVSEDLVFWKDLPLALSPTPGGPDSAGCWSGCAVNNQGTPTLLYTGVYPEVQCLATGSPDLERWEKHRGNPVISAPPPDLALMGFRDPFVWREDGIWHMVLGAGIVGVGGAVLHYQSRDLHQWDYRGPLLVGDGTTTGTMWECPNFFALGDRYVLLISVFPRAFAYYFVGRWEQGRFIPEREGRLDYGAPFFAPQTLLDSRGRRLMFGWVWEDRDEAAQQSAGWAGICSIPRKLTLTGDNTLEISPAEELQVLRSDHYHQESLHVDGGAVLQVVRGNCVEIICEIAPGTADRCGLRFCSTPQGEQLIEIAYNKAQRELLVDVAESSSPQQAKPNTHRAPLTLAAGEPLLLHVFFDRSVIEVFANGRVCITARAYPADGERAGLVLFAQSGTAEFRHLDVWNMQSVWG